jgi:hypothetical protein
MQAFLSHTLAEPGLRRLARTVDTALQEVRGGTGSGCAGCSPVRR